MNLCGIYRRRDAFFLRSYSMTVDGVWTASEPCVKLAADCSDRELGAAVRAALAASEQGISRPDPRLAGERMRPMLQAAGVKSYSTFAKGATSVDVEQDAEGVRVVSSANLGSRGGFQRIDDGVVLDDPADDELGAAVRAAHDRST
jgi:hypothetical protein